MRHYLGTDSERTDLSSSSLQVVGGHLNLDEVPEVCAATKSAGSYRVARTRARLSACAGVARRGTTSELKFNVHPVTTLSFLGHPAGHCITVHIVMRVPL